MDIHPPRILVSVLPEARGLIRRLLPDCELDFADSYADVALAMKSRQYSAAILDVHLGELQVRSLTRLIKDIQPEARLVTVDLSQEPLPDAARAALARIYKDCAE